MRWKDGSRSVFLLDLGGSRVGTQERVCMVWVLGGNVYDDNEWMTMEGA